MPGRWTRAPAVACWLAVAASLPACGQSVLAPLAGPAGIPPAPWTYAGLPEQAPPPTRYTVRDFEGRRVLHVEADRSYGNLVHALDRVPAGMLSWRWRVDEPLESADLRTREGDDAALKVCAMFDLPHERVPFIERQLLRLAQSRSGTTLPTATLCYVWDPTLPRGSLIPNAYSRRLRFVALGGPTGVWQTERHDLAGDFLRAFGSESDSVPPLRAIAVGADADNTAGRSQAWVEALVLEPAARP